MKYTLNDIFVVQAPLSDIDSRSECNPYHSDGMLPIFTAPMASVVDLNNYKLFEENKIIPIIPRTIDFSERVNLCHKTWCAFSLVEFEDLINRLHSFTDWVNSDGITRYILIDIANGAMLRLHNLIRDAKTKYGDKVQIMAGNIANPEAYRLLSDAGADYVRVGIGGGCFTEDMEVKTVRGLVKIKDINIGDEVLTHTGEYNTVKDVILHDNPGNILKINGIECTEDHEFYVIDKKFANLVNDNNYLVYGKWVSAIDLDMDIHLLIEL